MTTWAPGASASPHKPLEWYSEEMKIYLFSSHVFLFPGKFCAHLFHSREFWAQSPVTKNTYFFLGYYSVRQTFAEHCTVTACRIQDTANGTQDAWYRIQRHIFLSQILEPNMKLLQCAGHRIQDSLYNAQDTACMNSTHETAYKRLHIENNIWDTKYM